MIHNGAWFYPHPNTAVAMVDGRIASGDEITNRRKLTIRASQNLLLQPPIDSKYYKIKTTNNSINMPALGFGTLVHDLTQTIRTTRDALEAGFFCRLPLIIPNSIKNQQTHHLILRQANSLHSSPGQKRRYSHTGLQ